jgi:hypothetical protein
MVRPAQYRHLAVVLGTIALAGFVPLTARGEDATRALIEKLNQPINLDKGIDPNTPLKDALDFLADRHEVTAVIDTNAFKDDGVEKIEAEKVQLPKMNGVRLGTVLRLLLSQLNASYLVRSDYVEIVPTARLEQDIWAGRPGPRLPLVHAVIEKRPLGEALKELATTTGVSVVLDERPAEKAKSPVTAKLLNVPLDTAVRILADLADLKAVQLDNVLYVTSKENAKALQAEERERMLGGRELRKDARGGDKSEPKKDPSKDPK